MRKTSFFINHVQILLSLIILSSINSIFSSGCSQNCGSATVPYPFGFSLGCSIRLNCPSSNTISIAEFPVLNITPTSIFLNVSPSCNRTLDSVSRFFSKNFALMRSNGLLLRNCNSSSFNCSISTSLISSRLRTLNCENHNDSDNVSCFAHVPKDGDGNFTAKDEILATGCGFLYSSMAYKAGQSLTALIFSEVELGWWMDGQCNCSIHASCTKVTSPVSNGFAYRCECNEGFAGDGFVSGNGCSKAEKKGHFRAVIAAVAGVGGLFLLGTCVICLHVRRKRKVKANSSNLLSQTTSSILSSKMDHEAGETNYNTHIFTYDELEESTHGFHESQKLGRGGFCTVYKGKLQDGRTVAVKRLYENNCHLDQFLNEIKILSRLRHQNLVTLYGCTSRLSRELLLVYEYIPNGTVADHLHGSLASKGGLPWPIRMSISIQTAEALSYLHSIEPQIIHRDIKTTNILLDNNFQVKVADFGISRLFPLDGTHVSTRPQGTLGYFDPEYFLKFQLTDKSDVYSFGVLLLELISSKPAVDIRRHTDEINLANMAMIKIHMDRIVEFVDPDLGYESDLEVTKMIDQVVELAVRCLQSGGEMRPGIKEVTHMEHLSKIFQKLKYIAIQMLCHCNLFGFKQKLSVHIRLHST